jgi:hypothetical protein
VIGPILADLIGPTFVIFVSAAEQRKDKHVLARFSLQLAVLLNEVTSQLMERVGSASSPLSTRSPVFP